MEKLLVLPVGKTALRFGEKGGWATWDPHPWIGPSVLLRFADADERIVIAEIHVTARVGESVAGNDLRGVPFGTITAAVNRPSAREQVLALIRKKGKVIDLSGLAPARESFSDWERDVDRGKPSMRLKIPKERNRPDSFYAQVAELYLWLAAVGGSRRPAVDIAHANGVPTTTVHRWIREARERGLLSAGQRNRKGSA